MRTAALLLSSLLLAGCWQTPVPPPPKPTPLAPAIDAAAEAATANINASTAKDQATAKAVANIQTAETANAKQPAGPQTETVAGELGLAKRNLATPADPAELLAGEQRARALAEGRADEARRLYADAASKADAQVAKIAQLEARADAAEKAAAEALLKADASIRAEQVRLKAEYDAGLAAARLEAEADQRRLIGWIFYGGGALCIAAAAGCLFLASYVPQLGPRVALAIGAAGLALIGTGVAINQALSHPWIIWAGLGLVLVLVTAAAALIYANNHHHTSTPASP
jgi:hypothetical protein